MSGENTNSHLTDSSMIDLTDVDGTHTTGRVMGSVDSDADGKTDTYSVDTDDDDGDVAAGGDDAAASTHGLPQRGGRGDGRAVRPFQPFLQLPCDRFQILGNAAVFQGRDFGRVVRDLKPRSVAAGPNLHVALARHGRDHDAVGSGVERHFIRAVAQLVA